MRLEPASCVSQPFCFIHSSQGFPEPRSKLYDLTTRALLRSASGVITVSHWATPFLDRFKIGPDQLHVIHNGFDTREADDYLSRRNPDRFSHLDAKLPRDGPNILCVARLHPDKRIDRLIRVMPRVLEVVPGARLAIAGVGIEGDYLRNLIADSPAKDSISLLGLVTGDEKFECYARSSVFTLTSDYESFGLVLLEAGAFAKPVVATSIGGASEAIEQGKSGWLVEPGDSEALASSIVRLLTSPCEAQRMGENGRCRAEGEFTWTRSAEKLLRIANQALKGKSLSSRREPKVSVIVPTHNRANVLPRAVNSVLAQTFTDFEVLVVDDCSTDDTARVMADLELVDPRIRGFRHGLNRGSAATRNTGIANAVGEYLAFLDDDDEFLPKKLEKQVQVLDDAPSDVGMAYVWSEYVGPSGEILGSRCRTEEGDVFIDALILRLSVGVASTGLVRASALDVVGRFDESVLRCEDLEFMCRLSQHFKISCIPEILSRLHRSHSNRKSAPSKKGDIEWRDYVRSHQKRYSGEIAKRRRLGSSLWRRLALAELRVKNYVGTIRAISLAFSTDPTTAYLVIKWMVRGVFGRLLRRNLGHKVKLTSHVESW